MKKILIMGIDGYIGWALAQYLKERDYEVFGVDNGLRRIWVEEIGSQSLIPIISLKDKQFICKIHIDDKDESDNRVPDVIVHLAEQPSASFSMIDLKHTLFTQENNILGTLKILWILKKYPHIQLIKLGSMGVYGTPNENIQENDKPVAFDPNSFYHISKATDSMNIRKACEWWGLNATDLHQGIVYGHYPNTRFDYDSYFGTCVNRFLVQALVDYPLTVYGKGEQTRGFININDTLRCIELAIENPAKGYRVFNQFTEIFSINEIASLVSIITGAKIKGIDNPRIEKESHYYKPIHERLLKLGLEPHRMVNELEKTWKVIQPYKDRVIKEVIEPKTNWR